MTLSVALDIPATHPEAPWMVEHARHVCGRCGAVVLVAEPGLTWNLAPHVCTGDFEWLGGED